MNLNTRCGSFLWLFAVFACAIAAAYGGILSGRVGAAAVAAVPQDISSLERRLSLLEQRFYSMEINLNRLEQQLRLSAASGDAPAARVNETEIRLLRGEIEMLQRRLAEVECGLSSVDERTLTASSREARRGAGRADPCRLNAAAPVRLSARP